MPFLHSTPILSRLIPISQAEIDAPTAAQLADYSAMYMLEEAPYTKYHSDGVSLVPFGATIYATSAEFSALVSASELVTGSIYNVDGVLRVALTSSTWVNVAMIVETYTAAQLVTKTGAGTLAPFTIYAASDTGELTWAPDDSTLVSLGTIPNFTAAQLSALAAAGGLTPYATYAASDRDEISDATNASSLSKRLNGGQVAQVLVAASSVVKYPALSYFAPVVRTYSDWIQAELDYIQSNTATEFRGYWPLEGFQCDQTTPTFVICYPRVGSPPTNITFTWEVRKVGETVAQQQAGYSAGAHYMRWLCELDRGVWHEWRCKRGDSGAWSDWRPFYIRPDAATWIFSSTANTLADIKAKAHPRMKPPDFESRILKYKTGGALRAYATAAAGRFTTWSALAIAKPSSYTGNTLITECLIQYNAWWLEQSDGGGTYKTEALRRLRSMITGADAFIPANTPNNYSSQPQELRYLMMVLAAGWDLWQADLTAGDKTDLLALADAKIHTQYAGIASGVGTLDGMMGFHGYWRSITFTNRYMMCHAAACFAGDAGLSAQMIAETDDCASKIEFHSNWHANFGMHDGVNSESSYYADTDGFFAPNLYDMMGGLIGRDITTARPFLGDNVEAMATLFPYSGSSRMYPFGDVTDGSNGSVVMNTALMVPSPRSTVASWIRTAYADTATYATALAAQGTAFLPRSVIPDVPTARRFGAIYPDSGIAGTSDGRYKGVWAAVRCSPLGAHTHFYADQSSYCIGHGDKTLTPLLGAYKWAGAVGATSRQAAAKSSACNTIGMDLVDFDGGGGGTYLQCAGVQNWFNASTGIESALMRTRGRFLSAVDTAAYQALVCDSTDAYWKPGYELSKAWRAFVHIRPGLFVVMDVCDSSSGAHTWHHQFKTTVLPTYSSPWVTISDSPGILKMQTPYASGTVSRTLGNQGWWDAITPSVSPPAAPYNNSFDLPSATAMKMVVVMQAGSEAVTGVVASLTGNLLTCSVLYGGRSWSVEFDVNAGLIAVN